MTPNPSMDAGIPLLTEIIQNPAPDTAPGTAPESAPPPAFHEEAAAPQASATGVLSEEQWERLECEVRERVLRQVLDRIDFVLEQRVRDSLADTLQIAVENLATEIKAGLHHSIKDVVTRAVTQEIMKLQSTTK